MLGSGPVKFLGLVETAIAQKDPQTIKNRWTDAWSKTKEFPSLYARQQNTNQGLVTLHDQDFWDINWHFHVRFSASNIGMIYNQMIAAQGIIDPATNQLLVLKAPPPRNAPGPAPFD